MKYIITIILIVVASLSLAAQPKIKFIGGTTYNWGDVTPTVLRTKVKIKNIGNKPLFISKVKPSCGCTSAPISKRTLLPGDVAEMKVNLNLDISYSGKIVKKIEIFSNDPKHSKSTYYLKCNVVQPIKILPTMHIRFRDLTVGVEATSKMQIVNNSGKTVTLRDFETRPKDLSINLGKKITLKPGEKIDLIAKYRPTSDAPVDMQIAFKTSLKKMPRISITAFARPKVSNYFNSFPTR